MYHNNKGGVTMKQFLNKYSRFIVSIAVFFTSVSVNNACAIIIYQPKLPKSAAKYRKF